MPKVDAVLVNPISTRVLPAFVPHGLLYIAAYVIKQGHRVSVYDRNTEELNLEAVINKYQPKVVGLGCLTGTAIDDAVYVSRGIRKINPSIKITWGGIHTTLYPDSVLREDFVDFVIIGDGEYAFSDIIKSVSADDLPLESIDNLGYKEGDQLKYNRRSFVDMNTLAQPAWHLIDIQKYIRRKFYASRVLTINTSRGCPYKCAFCCVPSIHLGKWRAISAEAIVDNLLYLKNTYSIDGFQIDDDEFDIDRSRVLKLCDLLEQNKLNFKWSHFSRINIVREDILKREKECGLSLIEFGVESGSERMLQFLHKCQTLEQIKNAYSICQKLRLKTSALFMAGLPTETQDELRQTVKLIKQLKPHLTICTPYRPYPGTELFDYCIKNNIFRYPQNLEEVGGVYSRNINTSRVPDGLIHQFKRHFDLNSIYREIANCIFTANFELLVYYMRYNLFNGLKRMLKSIFYPRIKI